MRPVARPSESWSLSTGALAANPQVSGDAGQVYTDQQTVKVLDEAQKIARKAGDSYVPVERVLTALAVVRSRAKEALEAGNVSAQALNSAINDLRKGRTADTASAEDGYDALKRYGPRPYGGRRRGEDRPHHRT